MKRWPTNSAFFWEQAPFFRVTFFFCIGIVAAHYSPPPNDSPTLLVLLTALPLLAALLCHWYYNRARYLFATMLAIALVVAGYGVNTLNSVRVAHNWFGNQIDGAQAWLVTVKANPTETTHTYSIPVIVLRRIDSNGTTAFVGKAMVYLYKGHSPMLYRKGDTLMVPNQWQPLKSRANPFGFNFAAYAADNNIFHQLSCSPEAVQLYRTRDPVTFTLPERVRNWCLLQINEYVPDPEIAGLLAAMVTGDDSHLTNDLRQSFTATGIIHILVISGGNMMMVFTVVCWLLTLIKHERYRWIKYVVAIPPIWLYMLVAGGGPSPVRAAILFTLVAGGIIGQKQTNNLNLLFATAFVMLCLEPSWLWSVGFQLSFVAVLSLTLFANAINGLLRLRHPITRWLWDVMSASIAAELLVAPLVVCYFHLFPALFLITNVVAAALGLFAVYGTFVLLAFGWLPGVAYIIGMVLSYGVRLLTVVIDLLQHCSPASLSWLYLSTGQTLLLYAIIGSIGYFAIRKHKPAFFACLFGLVGLLVWLCTDAYRCGLQRRLVVYNVPKTCYAEYIAGNNVIPLINDTTANPDQIANSVLPGHIAWQCAPKRTPDTLGNCYFIDGQKIVVLRQPPPYTGTFDADIVVIAFTAKPDIETLKQTFHPALLVLSNNYTVAQQQQWEEACTEAHLPVHITHTDGYWMAAE